MGCQSSGTSANSKASQNKDKKTKTKNNNSKKKKKENKRGEQHSKIRNEKTHRVNTYVQPYEI